MILLWLATLELQKPLRRTEPDSPGRRLDAGQNRDQEFLKKIGWREVGTSELGYFFERFVNMAGRSPVLLLRFERIRWVHGITHRTVFLWDSALECRRR